MNNTRNIRRKKRKKRFLRLTILFMLLTILAGGSYLAFDFIYSAKQASDSIYQELDSSKLANQRAEVEVTKDPFNILLVGIEDQEGGERADVLLLLTVNPQTKEIYMLSIPRDTRTYVESAGYETKINHSLGFGGIESTISTVSELLDVPIDYYMTTNFNGFEDIVDTLGGITVDVPFTFKAQLTGSLKWKTYTEGPMDLNGNEALAYVRMRKADPKGDMGRNERQQQVIQEIVDKGTSFTSITKIDDIMDDLGENVKMNIPPSKFASFVKLYTQIKDSQIQHLALEGYDDYIDSVYYYIPYEESLTNLSTTLNNVLESTSTSLTTINKESTSDLETAQGDE